MFYRQEEAGSLEFQWMKEYGSTWRTRGVFGVSSGPAFSHIPFLTRMRAADGRLDDGGPEGISFTYCTRSEPLPNYRFARPSSMCSRNPATIIPRRRLRTSWDT